MKVKNESSLISTRIYRSIQKEELGRNKLFILGDEMRRNAQMYINYNFRQWNN